MVLGDGTDYPYGFGWELDPKDGKTAVSHGGALPGFRTYIMRVMDGQTTVVALTNCDCISGLPGIVERIASFYDAPQ